jgi:hypothetical protein
MATIVTSSANRFSMNGVVFKDFVNLDRVILVSLCKDRYYERFDILLFFSLGTRNSSYTDETLLRIGPFPNKYLDKATELIGRILNDKDGVFNIEEELFGDELHTEDNRHEDHDFANQAKSIAVETAKKMKSEGVPVEVICKVLGLTEIEFK